MERNIFKIPIFSRTKNEELKNTLLYSLIQNKRIQIRDNYLDTFFNQMMKEETTFDEICKEIKNINLKQINKTSWKKEKSIWTKIEFPPSASESAKQQENDEGTKSQLPAASKELKQGEEKTDRSLNRKSTAQRKQKTTNRKKIMEA